ncbi:hypothetical protein FA95DRAFT_1388846 [Auriscalpium vulgare]|uniref:Uncharacterized protein n=1 Tax=Auriscalpium vulgare TaxID=40419 RepID=A0ACB8S7S8_9AGAM|nr:hypothetical protein FA95DRAFT_1388846 [Auriscalpium vulgare]
MQNSVNPGTLRAPLQDDSANIEGEAWPKLPSRSVSRPHKTAPLPRRADKVGGKTLAERHRASRPPSKVSRGTGKTRIVIGGTRPSGKAKDKGRATFQPDYSESKGQPSTYTSLDVEAMTALGLAYSAEGQKKDGPSGGPGSLVVASHNSSDPEAATDSDEDEYSWTEDSSADESEGEESSHPEPEDKPIREAESEAQRQRELFTKQPKHSYSNLSRAESGHLTTMLNPDPFFPPNHLLDSKSPADVAPSQQHLRGASSSTASPTQPLPFTAQMNAQGLPTKGDIGSYHPDGRAQDSGEDDWDENFNHNIHVSPSLAQKTSHPVQPVSIPLNHQWDLPPPVAPSTPRTTRRQMLTTELSGSLRQNLLWKRQVDGASVVGPDAHYRSGASTSMAQAQDLHGLSGQGERKSSDSERGQDRIGLDTNTSQGSH